MLLDGKQRLAIVLTILHEIERHPDLSLVHLPAMVKITEALSQDVFGFTVDDEIDVTVEEYIQIIYKLLER